MSTAPRARALAAGQLGGAVVHDIWRVSDKSVLALGERDGQPVVIKALRTGDPFWVAKFAREIGVYQAFATTPPPVRVPRLVHTDGHTVLVLEYISGRPLDRERYPGTPVPAAILGAALTTVSAFGRWCPPPGVLAPVFDYPDRIARYHRAGFLDDADRAALQALLPAAGGTDAVQHGDPLPSNLLLSGPGECVLIDWEFTGLFLPGFDLALMHAVLAQTPEARDQVEVLVAEAGIEAAFAINQAMVLSRELRLHTELPPGAFRDRRLALLHPRWDTFRDHLHAQR
jgi:aminoglycoside phosphotransferase (APT) family kinase protein